MEIYISTDRTQWEQIYFADIGSLIITKTKTNKEEKLTMSDVEQNLLKYIFEKYNKTFVFRFSARL